VRNGRDIAVTSHEQTTDTTADFVRMLLVLFPTQPLFLLLDRAPWHHGAASDHLLTDNPRLELIYFPPACPELNPQEHIWEQARDTVGHNHQSAHFSTLSTPFSMRPRSTPIS